MSIPVKPEAPGAGVSRKLRALRERKPPLPQPPVTYHRLRKAVHAACFSAFVLLPFSNLLRFDIPRQRFHFLGRELWISEFGVLFFSLMFLMFVVVVAAMMYGRFFCGYLCPQMIFSEASIALENRLRRMVNRGLRKRSAFTRNLLARGSFYTATAIASVFLAFVFISYFVEPRDLLSRLLSLDLRTAGGISGATVTLITFLDFTLVRQRFCTTVCPYGYLQGMLTDGSTMLVHYRDEGRECIECGKCVRVCHMGIDIRTSPYQIECIHCGECIDACADVLGKLGSKGLIHYVWGESGPLLTERAGSWYRRLGLRDAKRFAVMLVLLFYAAGLYVALSMRHDVLVRLTPERETLYRVGDDGRVYNRFRLNLANRSSLPASVVLSVEDLPGARLGLERNPVPLAAGEQLEMLFEISVVPFRDVREVNHFRVRAHADPEGTEEVADLTFLMPPEKPPR